MKKQSITLLAFALLFAQTSGDALGVSARATSQYIKPDTYNYMYPYMNNQMRTDLNPGVTVSQSTNPMDVVVKTKSLSPNSTSERRVVPRRTTNTNARAAQIGGVAQPTQRIAQQQNTDTRRVVARRANNGGGMVARGTRQQTSTVTRNNARSGATNKTSFITPVSSSRCMADYTECMNRYCLREDTEYNRCYCSSKLSQIDAKYKPEIENLFTKILTAKDTNKWSDAEMNEYWTDIVGKYSTGNTNSWANLDAALDINWASTESTVRGQNAFAMGHQYCVQHLNNCYYMSSNLRDAYRSEIARDCAIYEQSLQKIKTAAESVLEYYND